MWCNEAFVCRYLVRYRFDKDHVVETVILATSIKQAIDRVIRQARIKIKLTDIISVKGVNHYETKL